MVRWFVVGTVVVAVSACGGGGQRGPAGTASSAPPATHDASTAKTAGSATTAGPDAPSPPVATAPPVVIVIKHDVVPEDMLHADIMRRLSFRPPSPCAEQELPAEAQISHALPAAGTTAGDPGGGLAPAAPRANVTSGHAAGRVATVYLSNALDPASELGDAGYRVRIVDDVHGAKHDVPLGFAMLRPYVVYDDPKLPIVDGDALQIAADVRDVDDATVTFPPIALRSKREAQGRMLRCPLAALFADSDHDGATDVEEARLVTDRGDADTDGDGLLDSKDPTPLGAVAPKTDAEKLWVAVMRDLVAPKVEGQLVIVEVEGARLAIPHLPMRLLQLHHDEIEAYERVFGKRVIAKVKVETSGSYSGKVALSLGWTGAWTSSYASDGDKWTYSSTTWWVR